MLSSATAQDTQNSYTFQRVWIEDGITAIAYDPIRNAITTNNSISKLVSRSGDRHIYLDESLKGMNALSLAYSYDGSLLAAGLDDTRLKVWEPSNLAKDPRIFYLDSKVSAIAFSPNGKYLAAGTDTGCVYIWSVTSFQSLGSFLTDGGQISSIDFSPDSRYFLTSSKNNNKINIWNPTDENFVQTIVSDFSGINSAAYSPDGSRIAAGHKNGLIIICDAKTGRKITTLKGHSGAVNSLAYNTIGHSLASGSDDKTIMVWNTDNGILEKTFIGHSNRVVSIAYSPDGKRIASGSNDGTYRMWEIISPEDIAREKAQREAQQKLDIEKTIQALDKEIEAVKNMDNRQFFQFLGGGARLMEGKNNE
jgi:WD40 repeat protein